jgi:hypothetical protein
MGMARAIEQRSETAVIVRILLAGLSCMTVAVITASPSAAGADELEDVLAGRPAFSAPEQPAPSWGRCTDIRRMAEGVPEMEGRIDLSVSGAVAEVKTDGVLRYVVLCNTPDVKVLCVTYSANDLKVGDIAYAKGGYRRIDANHALLDPCFASERSEW